MTSSSQTFQICMPTISNNHIIQNRYVCVSVETSLFSVVYFWAIAIMQTFLDHWSFFCGESCHDKSLVFQTVLFFVLNCMNCSLAWALCVSDRYCLDMCLQKIKVFLRTNSRHRLLSYLTDITWALVKHQIFINNKPELSRLFFSNPFFFLFFVSVVWHPYGLNNLLLFSI